MSCRKLHSGHAQNKRGNKAREGDQGSRPSAMQACFRSETSLSGLVVNVLRRSRSQWLSLAVVYIYPVEPNLCDKVTVTDSILGEYMDDEKTSIY